MKKIVILIALAIMLAGLCGCGGRQHEESYPGDGGEPTEENYFGGVGKLKAFDGGYYFYDNNKRHNSDQ